MSEPNTPQQIARPDVDAIMERIRRELNMPATPPAVVSEGPFAELLRAMEDSFQPGTLPAGARLTWLKRMVVRLSRVVMRDQERFNASALAALRMLAVEHQRQAGRIAQLQRRLAAVQQQLDLRPAGPSVQEGGQP